MELLKEIELTLLPYAKILALLIVLGVLSRLFK